MTDFYEISNWLFGFVGLVAILAGGAAYLRNKKNLRFAVGAIATLRSGVDTDIDFAQKTSHLRAICFFPPNSGHKLDTLVLPLVIINTGRTSIEDVVVKLKYRKDLFYSNQVLLDTHIKVSEDVGDGEILDKEYWKTFLGNRSALIDFDYIWVNFRIGKLRPGQHFAFSEVLKIFDRPYEVTKSSLYDRFRVSLRLATQVFSVERLDISFLADGIDQVDEVIYLMASQLGADRPSELTDELSRIGSAFWAGSPPIPGERFWLPPWRRQSPIIRGRVDGLLIEPQVENGFAYVSGANFGSAFATFSAPTFDIEAAPYDVDSFQSALKWWMKRDQP